jgi:hypothetical protein
METSSRESSHRERAGSSHAWLWLPAAILGLLACFTLIYTVSKTLDSSGAIDFHSYWFAGHFVRQGNDPFSAYLEKADPEIPPGYIDRSSPAAAVRQPGLADVPANTPTLVLILSTFSFFSWPLAKLLWMICNLILMAVTPFLVLRLLAPDLTFSRQETILIWAAFLALFGTRNVAGNGQTSMLVFAMMLAAMLLARRSWWGSGLALGIALSKFTLSLPVFLILLFERRYRIIAAALVVQLAGLLALSGLTGSNPIAMASNYLEIVRVHADLPGIHLGALFPDSGTWAAASVIILSGIVFGSLAGWIYDMLGRLSMSPIEGLARYQVLTILVLWILLAVYHRAYDSFTAILLLVTGLGAAARPALWRLSHRERWFLAVFTALSTAVLVLPASSIVVLRGFINETVIQAWPAIQNYSITVTLAAGLACSIWLLFRFGRNPDRSLRGSS